MASVRVHVKKGWQSGHGGRARKSYDTAFKLKIVSCVDSQNNRGAAQRFRVDERCVREWGKLTAETKHPCDKTEHSAKGLRN